MEQLELEPGFEPQIRARSNTWPLPRPENYIDKDDNNSGNLINIDPTKLELLHSGGVVTANVPSNALPSLGHLVSPNVAAGLPKKNSSRRNAWGNMSYADLITQAIQSAPDKRLTLSQIYEWMVQNVPYFKDKGDSNSSAGWKNSIRHNLSLHNRFMRVQNEGTGKSSWWMINPDAKPGKSARRRATSMETSKFEKRRGRVKKKVEALRNGLDTTPSPSSSVSEGLDLFPDSPVHPAFQLSPEFRPRASSNASSCGRLSPIPAVESDSQLAWSPTDGSGGEGARNGEYSPGVYASERYGPEQLAGNLAEGMKLGGEAAAFLAECRQQQQQQQQQQHMGSPAYPPPPPYEFHNRLAPPSYGLQPSVQCPVHRHQPCGCSFLEPLHHRCKREAMSPSLSPVLSHAGSYVTSSEPSPESLHQMSGGGGGVLSYRNGLIGQQNISSAMVKSEGRTTPTPSQMMGQLMGALNTHSNIIDDLNLNIEPLDGGFDCNVDEVIKHELSMDGNLEFNFSSHQHHHHLHHHHQHHLHHMQQPVEGHLHAPPPVGGVVVNQQGVPAYTTSVATGHSWVH